MTKFLLAPDKFKGCLSNREVALALERGIRQARNHAKIRLMPIADGGEGTAQTLGAARQGHREEIASVDALGRACAVPVFLWNDIAAFDVAAVVGLAQVAPALRNPWKSSTRGVGIVLRELAARRVGRILIGLGGSATNDAGIGMAAELGTQFLDRIGHEVTPHPDTFDRIETVCPPDQPYGVPIVALCDVINPLLGKNGASHVFGPQKGLRNPDEMDAALARLSARLATALPQDHRETPRVGAAGGLGYGLAMFCDADLVDGFATVSEVLGLEQAVIAADAVITGEGRLDRQTLSGKGPAGVACLARRHGKAVHVFCGTVEAGMETSPLFDGVHPLVDGIITPAGALARAGALLAEKAAGLARQLW